MATIKNHGQRTRRWRRPAPSASLSPPIRRKCPRGTKSWHSFGPRLPTTRSTSQGGLQRRSRFVVAARVELQASAQSERLRRITASFAISTAASAISLPSSKISSGPGRRPASRLTDRIRPSFIFTPGRLKGVTAMTVFMICASLLLFAGMIVLALDGY